MLNNKANFISTLSDQFRISSNWRDAKAKRFTHDARNAEAAKRLKVSQPRISDLTRGKISRFSLDTLVNMLTDAGLKVNVRIKPPSRRVA